jgi:hypothetical protein
VHDTGLAQVVRRLHWGAPSVRISDDGCNFLAAAHSIFLGGFRTTAPVLVASSEMGRHPKPVTKAAVPSASADCPALTGEPEEADITSPIFFGAEIRSLDCGPSRSVT